MSGNKQAYEAAYQRALEGKSSRTLVEFLMAPFEDTYTRRSREQGRRDGEAARAEMLSKGEGAAQPS